MRHCFLILCLSALAYGTTETKPNMLTVPEETMSFLLKCGKGDIGPKIPMSKTEIDPESGTTTEEISMMDISQLRESLLQTVESEQVVERIIGQIEDSLAAQTKGIQGRQGCTNIQVEVPPQEVTGLNETLQAVVQQNNYQLLHQFNTLLSFKLNSLKKELETLIAAKFDEIKASVSPTKSPPSAPAEAAVVEKISPVTEKEQPKTAEQPKEAPVPQRDASEKPQQQPAEVAEASEKSAPSEAKVEVAEETYTEPHPEPGPEPEPEPEDSSKPSPNILSNRRKPIINRQRRPRPSIKQPTSEDEPSPGDGSADEEETKVAAPRLVGPRRRFQLRMPNRRRRIHRPS